MRIALVCDWFLPRLGGIELHLRDLALALRAQGMDARVVTTIPGADEIDGVPVHRVRSALAPGASVAVSPSLLPRLGELLRAERFDVVHAHASVVSPVAYGGAMAGARLGLPTVLTFHSMLHRTAFLLGASEALLGWVGRVTLSAVSSVVARQAARWMPDAHIGILPNGIDAAFWRGAPSVRRSHDELLFVAAMRLSRKKRPRRLLRAFAEAGRLLRGAPAARLVIAGEGPDAEALRRYSAELGIADRVELRGQLARSELRALYQRADVFVSASERESFGLAALEARAAGLPVIGMLESGARDFIHHGVNGLLARDAGELSRAIVRMSLDAPFRRYVAARNASEPPSYDWAEVAEIHERFYAAAGRVA
jgi:glycosyltransferase involved in cell wall biosynthesis